MFKHIRVVALSLAVALLCGTAGSAFAGPSGIPWGSEGARARIAKAIIRSTPRVGSTGGTAEAPEESASPCYYSIFSDAEGDAAELDAVVYASTYNCSMSVWRFPMATTDEWDDPELDYSAVFLDVDGNPSTGCGGFDSISIGFYDPDTDDFLAGVLGTPTCDPASWSVAGGAVVDRDDGASVALQFENASIGSPTTIRWIAVLKGINEDDADVMPDDGYHTESGFDGPCDTTPSTSRAQRSYAVVEQGGGDAHAFGPASAAVIRSDSVVTFKGDPWATALRARRAGVIARITRDVSLRLDSAPNDPAYGSQWALSSVRAHGAWRFTHGDPDVVVAVIDSGIDGTHPDLEDKVVAGYDVVANAPIDPTTNSDGDGHGTAVAGVIGARTDNGTDIASLGWETRLMPVKVDDATGALYTSAVVAGIRHASAAGADVINISLGGQCSDANLEQAVRDAQTGGALVVAAAGNAAQDGDRIHYPAAYPDVLAIGAIGADGRWAPYSNFGDYVDLVAPGGSGNGDASADVTVLSLGGGTTTAAGTSMSAPMVSAAAALMMALAPDTPALEIADILIATAADRGAVGVDPAYGAGVLDAHAAIAGVAPSVRLPDLQIRMVTERVYAGDDVYNTNGARQSEAVRVARGKTTKFYVAVENDGSRTEQIMLAGTAPAKGFAVRFFLGTGRSEITRSVLGKTYRSVAVPVGRSFVVRVEVTAAKDAKARAAWSGTLRATSSVERARGDTVGWAVRT